MSPDTTPLLPLAPKSEDAIEVKPPKQLSGPYLETLEADPRVVDLHSWSPYFFDYGMAVSRLMSDENIANALTFVRRQ
jgi:hypothetical protein